MLPGMMIYQKAAMTKPSIKRRIDDLESCSTELPTVFGWSNWENPDRYHVGDQLLTRDEFEDQYPDDQYHRIVFQWVEGMGAND